MIVVEVQESTKNLFLTLDLETMYDVYNNHQIAYEFEDGKPARAIVE